MRLGADHAREQSCRRERRRAVAVRAHRQLGTGPWGRSAPYATAVLNGRRVFSPARDPQTEIWFMLYAQAMQADGASQRNILLGHVAGVPLGQKLIHQRLNGLQINMTSLSRR